MPRTELAAVAFVVALCAFPAHAQFGRGAGDYSTIGSDAQRSSWVRTDAKISPAALQKPGFEFLWKVKLEGDGRQANALTPAALLTFYIGYRGFRALAFSGGSADKVLAVDTDLGRVEWTKSLMSGTAPQGTAACPGGMTANVARPVSAAFPASMPVGRGGGSGRGAAAKSGVGEPGEGATILKEMAARGSANSFNPPPPANPPAGRRGAADAGRGAPAPNPYARGAAWLYAISSDGMFHSMYVSNGEEPHPPVRFLPANANAQGLIVVDNAAYATTTGACGGAPDAVWALDVASEQAASWKPAAGGIAGTGGVAFGGDGTLFVATTSGDLAALEPKTLKVKDVFKAGQELTSSPLVFQQKDKAMIAAATSDGRIHAIDAAALSGAGMQSAPVAAGSGFRPGALASYQDSAGTRYILVPTPSSVVALKLTDQGFETAWTSPEIAAPLTPLIVNGVVFAASNGDRSRPAVLYALDGVTGKPLWNSGKTITSFARNGGISAGGSQVYLGTYDGTLYAFGFPIEH
ncbi:MAG TPA: PQQ-binding-like beta-propeller repeat protein [Verrucomicrobiae bacterium]|nr:PQQ-binding-like beta-propeller repeat protein [Verrucomicrobiae bacterium]